MRLLSLFMLMFTLQPHTSAMNCNFENNISVQNLNNKNPIKKIVRAIETAGVFILAAPQNPDEDFHRQIENEKLLTSLATGDELEKLVLDHKSATVRAYAFKAFTLQKHDIPDNVMHKVLADTAVVNVINGEKKEVVAVNELIVNFLF